MNRCECTVKNTTNQTRDQPEMHYAQWMIVHQTMQRLAQQKIACRVQSAVISPLSCMMRDGGLMSSKESETVHNHAKDDVQSLTCRPSMCLIVCMQIRLNMDKVAH